MAKNAKILPFMREPKVAKQTKIGQMASPDDRITATYGKVTFNPPKELQLGPKHPFKNAVNHEKLLQYCMDRMMMARETRDSLAERMRNIDIDTHGFVKLSDEDRERQRHNRNGKGGQKPVDVNLPLADAKLDDMVTFLSEVFWPAQGMYQANALPDEQFIAKGMAASLNKQANKKEHFSKLAKFFYEGMRYNICAVMPEWVQEKGLALGQDAAGKRVVKDDEVTFEGNDLTNLDPYNLFWDPSVHPCNLAAKGEYFAYVELLSKFAVKRDGASEKLYGTERFINQFNNQLGTTSTYYYEHPVVRFDYSATTGTTTDWYKFATGGRYGTIGNGIELVTMCIWINPKEFGLSEEDELQVWKLKIANHLYIAFAQQQTNVHQRLPICFSVPFDDNLKLQHKSAAEMLISFNTFASFLLNIHQESTRKKLYGLTIYDPSIVDLKQQGTEVAGRIPLMPSGYGKPIKDGIQTFFDAPETEHNLDQINQINQMMDKILPSSINEQAAGLDRATEFQAASVVYGTNRKQFKMARIIDDQAIKNLRYICISNTMQYATKGIKVTGDDGKEQTIEADQFAQLEIDDYIGEGIQGIDKIITINLLHDVINTVVQNQQASQELDVVKFIGYWMSLIGENVNIEQFRRQQLPPQQQADKATEIAGLANDAQANQNGQQGAPALTSQQAPQMPQQPAPQGVPPGFGR